MTQVRADLHVHSKYSDRPSEWILRRLGSPESFTEPLDVYHRCKQRGMRFVTISDHNRIDGALAISHLPDTFLSVEITTYFPEDGAKMHILASGITEAQFTRIQQARESIYDLRQLMIDEDLALSVAHPFFRVNDRLTPDHIEKLLVLFNRFEGINGTRDRRAADMVNRIFRNVTEDDIARYADKHNLEPAGPQPWAKTFTGGSDDHGGVYIASACTVTPEADTAEQYIEHLRRGRHEMSGRSGDSVQLAHSFYHIAYTYYRQRILNSANGKPSVLGELFRRLLERPQQQNDTGLRGRARSMVHRIVAPRRQKQLSEIERNLVAEFTALLSAHEAGKGPNPQPALTEQETFDLACRICHQLSYSFVKGFIEHARSGDLIHSLQTIAALGPVAISISPYLAAMATQHKDEQFLKAVAARFDIACDMRHRSDKRAWLTDTLTDVNGVARTIEHMADVAVKRGEGLTVVSCVDNPPATDYPLKNFAPVGRFKMPEYDQQAITVPPLLEMIEYLERERFGELILSTPGPVGMAGLAAAKLMGLRVVGIYHTDFPRYVHTLTEDEGLEQMTWKFMAWFYDQMDLVFVPSAAYRRQLMDMGIEPNKLRILGRGVDLQQFSPEHRSADFWRDHGLSDGTTFVYVGRVSEEKGVRRLLDGFTRMPMTETPIRLAIVGDGPLLAELRRKYHRPDIVFTGLLTGDELAAAYASADAFVFPSTTDTFGNVILEAAASGLPAIVTNQGGPQELVEPGRSGIVVDAAQPDEMINAMQTLAADAAMRKQMGAAARHAAMAHAWDSSFDIFWERDDDAPIVISKPMHKYASRAKVTA